MTFGASMETFDLNGNLATFTDVSGTITCTWNARNQLIVISGPSLTASFTYDSFGRRTGKTINGTTTNFVYDGPNPVQEKNGGTVTANLLTGLGIDELFTRTDGVGVRSLLPDALGSTIALGDNAGTLQTQYTYEPFGVTTQTGAASTLEGVRSCIVHPDEPYSASWPATAHRISWGALPRHHPRQRPALVELWACTIDNQSPRAPFS